MNYIKHLNQFFDKVKEDERLTPFDVSLYMALFYQWNQSHFQKFISIARDEIKKMARIGSNNTYSKCLKDLTNWKYLSYSPSYYKHNGSKVKMYNFDTGTDTGSNTGTDTGGDTGTDTSEHMKYTSDTSTNTSSHTGKEMEYTFDTGGDTGSDTGDVQVVRPYINNIKHNKTILNNTNNIREEEKILNLKNGQVEDQKNAFPENLENLAGETFPPSTLTEVQVQLNEKKKVALKKKSGDGYRNFKNQYLKKQLEKVMVSRSKPDSSGENDV